MNKQKALEIFGLEDTGAFSKERIRKIYKKLAKIRHPDSETGSQKAFVELQDAFGVLIKLAEDFPASDSTDLKTLSKDEILAKYMEEKDELQNQISLYKSSLSQQNDIIEELKEQVKVIVDGFEVEKKRLQEKLENDVEKLEKKYSKSLFKKLLFFLPFLPNMSEEEFWDKYHELIDDYSRMHAQLDVEFFKEMLSTYGHGLNKISKNTTVENLVVEEK